MADKGEKGEFPILIVDDESQIVEALSNYLSEYEVDVAYDANSALEKAATGEFKIILTDIAMPDLDGIELLKRVKDISPGIQVIMMTGQTTLTRASEAMKAGALKYLLKPFDDISEIDRAIEEAITKIKDWKDIFQKTILTKKRGD